MNAVIMIFITPTFSYYNSHRDYDSYRNDFHPNDDLCSSDFSHNCKTKYKRSPKLTLLLVALARDVIPELEGEATVEGEDPGGGAATGAGALVVDEVEGA